MRNKKEAIEAIVYISTSDGINWYLTIDNQQTGHVTDLYITHTQKEVLIEEGIPII